MTEMEHPCSFIYTELPPSSSAPPDRSVVFGTEPDAHVYSRSRRTGMFEAGVLAVTLAFPGIPATVEAGQTVENRSLLRLSFEQLHSQTDRKVARSTSETEPADLFRVEKARGEFRRFLVASRLERSKLADIIRATVAPEDLFAAAYEDYRIAGNEQRLILLINLLAGFHGGAVLALSQAAEDSSDDVELFVDLAAELEGITDSVRAKLLGQFAASPSSLVRMRVLEHFDVLTKEYAVGLLTKLCEDIDEEVATAAQDALEDLDAS